MQEKEKKSFLRYLLDEEILLLFLGVVVFAVLYLIWGIMEIANIPDFPTELKNKILGG